MTLKKPALLLAAVACAAAFAGPAASPAAANCATIMIGDQQTCLENILCAARDFAADANEKTAATVRKAYSNDYCDG